MRAASILTYRREKAKRYGLNENDAEKTPKYARAVEGWRPPRPSKGPGVPKTSQRRRKNASAKGICCRTALRASRAPPYFGEKSEDCRERAPIHECERTPIHGCERCPSVNAGARRAVSATKRRHKKEGPGWGNRVLLVGVCRRPCSSPFHPRASARVVAWVLAPRLAARTRPNKTSGRIPSPSGESSGPNELRSAAMRTPKSSTVLAPS